MTVVTQDVQRICVREAITMIKWQLLEIDVEVVFLGRDGKAGKWNLVVST